MQLHRYRRFLPGGLLLLLFAATCAGNGPELHNIARTALRQADSWNGRSYAGNGEHTDAPRELVETELPPGAALFYPKKSSWSLIRAAQPCGSGPE